MPPKKRPASSATASTPRAAVRHKSDAAAAAGTTVPVKDMLRACETRMYQMYTEQQLTDVTIVAGGVRIAAHRAVLAAASPHFFALFTSGMAESRQQEITLQEVGGSALKAIVDCIYTGEALVDCCV